MFKRTRVDALKEVTVRETPQVGIVVDGVPVFPSQGGFMKPAGFWYSVNGGWENWCVSDAPQWLEGKYIHRVHMGDEKMLTLRAPEDLDVFTARYALKLPGAPTMDWINWHKVAEEFDGIEIAPYHETRRFDCIWYYGWDCASGCIWRPKGVKVTYVP